MAPSPDKRAPTRRFMYAVIAGNQMCNYAVRLALPSLVQVASKEMQLSDAAKAMLLSAHTPGYLLTQIPSGMLTQHVGAKRLLTLNTGGAAIMLALVPIAAVRGGARGARVYTSGGDLPTRIVCEQHLSIALVRLSWSHCSYGCFYRYDGTLSRTDDPVSIRAEAPVAASRRRTSMGIAIYQLRGFVRFAFQLVTLTFYCLAMQRSCNTIDATVSIPQGNSLLSQPQSPRGSAQGLVGRGQHTCLQDQHCYFLLSGSSQHLCVAMMWFALVSTIWCRTDGSISILMTARLVRIALFMPRATLQY